MKNHWKYLIYVCKHKWFVFRAGIWTGVPLWRLIIHDFSKFSHAEWTPYVNRFFSGRTGQLDKESDPDEFHKAWNHHWHNNTHHWEHWLRFGKDGLVPMKMPNDSVLEMFADWMGAGRGITGDWDILDWYEKSTKRMQLHEDTRKHVEALINDFRGSKFVKNA